MDPCTEQINDKLRRTRYKLRTSHRQMDLILGLHSLLQLQYVQEGHRDEAVDRRLDELLHNHESELADTLGGLLVEELPF